MLRLLHKYKHYIGFLRSRLLACFKYFTIVFTILPIFPLAATSTSDAGSLRGEEDVGYDRDEDVFYDNQQFYIDGRATQSGPSSRQTVPRFPADTPSWE